MDRNFVTRQSPSKLLRDDSASDGFTLVEVLIAIAIFTVIILISLVLTIQSIRTVQQNQNITFARGQLNTAVDRVSRAVLYSDPVGIAAADGTQFQVDIPVNGPDAGCRRDIFYTEADPAAPGLHRLVSRTQSFSTVCDALGNTAVTTGNVTVIAERLTVPGLFSFKTATGDPATTLSTIRTVMFTATIQGLSGRADQTITTSMTRRNA